MAWRDLYPFESHFLALGSHRLHYLDEGAGEPLLFIHGNPTWSFYWRNLVLGLRDYCGKNGFRDVVIGLSGGIDSTIAAVLAVSALLPPAEAQHRKSLRWATSSVDSYGYKVAASMTKMVEEALGGEYTVTVNPYPQTTSATKAAMEDNAEIGYTAKPSAI